MSKIDLSGYNLAELKGLQFEVEKAIKERQNVEMKKARDQIQAIAEGLGVSVQDLLAGSGAKSKAGTGAKVEAQYQNPADPSQTWTGRGRQPKFVQDAIAAGKTLEDLRIKSKPYQVGQRKCPNRGIFAF